MKVTLLAILVLLTGCARPEGDPVMAVQEAVFRFQFKRNASVQQDRAAVYFLAFNDPIAREAVDPPDEFIARFARSRPRVARFSEAGRVDGGWVVDKKTGEGGIIFFVSDVRIIGRDTAEARGGYLEDRRSGSRNTYRLKLGWRGWAIVEARLDGISNKEPNQTSEPTFGLRPLVAHL
jgi:hypothetical protein